MLDRRTKKSANVISGERSSCFMNAEDLKSIDWKIISEKSKEKDGGMCAYFTSGTTDKPKTLYYSKQEFELAAKYLKWFCEVEGIAGGHKVIVFMDQFFWGIGYLTMLGHVAAGNSVIPVDTDLPRDVVCEIVKMAQPTVISSIPSAILEYKEALKCDSLRFLETTGETLTNKLRKELEAYFAAEVFDAYGLTEGLIGVECSVHDGYHFMPKNVKLEIVDKKEGKRVKDGIWGELVMTNNLRTSVPKIVRYKTGDICKVSHECCACGLNYPKVWIKGRVEEEIELYEGFMLPVKSIKNIIEKICGSNLNYAVKKSEINSKYVLNVSIDGACGEDCAKIKDEIEKLNYEMFHMTSVEKLEVIVRNYIS